MRSIIKMCTISISGLSQGLGIETKRILYQKFINLKGDSFMSTFSKQRLEFFGYAKETSTHRLRMALQFFLRFSLFAKPCCIYQPSRANSKISYKVGNWHAPPPYEETGPSFLTAATTSGWSDYRLQDIQGPFGYWSELVFTSSRPTRPKRAPLQRTPKERAPGFRRYSFSCQRVREMVGEHLDRSLSPSPSLTEYSTPPPPPFIYSSRHPIRTPPISSYHLCMLTDSLFYICFFFASVMTYFAPL